MTAGRLARGAISNYGQPTRARNDGGGAMIRIFPKKIVSRDSEAFDR